jgi:lipid A 3-O-deacylase
LLALIELLSLILVFLVANFAVYAEQREEFEMINITAGQIGIFDGIDGPQRYGLEYRFKSFAGPAGFRLIPTIGVAAANNGAKFIYSDLKHDFYFYDKWVLTPSLGVGLFDDSEEIHLGNEVEFREGLEFAYQFRNKMRAGIALFHMSNGGIASHNPGTEVLVFSFIIPVMGN